MTVFVTESPNAIAAKIAQDMRQLPEEFRKSVRPKLRDIGNIVAQDAKSRAGWSGRIPNTVRVRTSFTASREGVTIIAGGPNAPHARHYEDVAGKGSFRHPLFGNRKRWYSQQSRPFLFPAARAHEAETTAAVFAALGVAATAIGFEG